MRHCGLSRVFLLRQCAPVISPRGPARAAATSALNGVSNVVRALWPRVCAVGVTEVQDRKRLFELVTRVREVRPLPLCVWLCLCVSSVVNLCVCVWVCPQAAKKDVKPGGDGKAVEAPAKLRSDVSPKRQPLTTPLIIAAKPSPVASEPMTPTPTADPRRRRNTSAVPQQSPPEEHRSPSDSAVAGPCPPPVCWRARVCVPV